MIAAYLTRVQPPPQPTKKRKKLANLEPVDDERFLAVMQELGEFVGLLMAPLGEDSWPTGWKM